MIFHVDFNVTFRIRYQNKNILEIWGNIFNNKLWFPSKGNTDVKYFQFERSHESHDSCD